MERVVVRIETPWDTVTGDYLVTVEASEDVQSNTGMITVNTRDFNFNIHVKGIPPQEKEISSLPINETNRTILIKNVDKEEKKEYERWWLPPLLITVLLLLILTKRS